MLNNLTEETMALLKNLQSTPMAKATDSYGITTATGIVNYNLEPYAKTLYPVITPFRNKVNRVTDTNGGTAVNWKIVTAINAGRTFPGTSEGIRGATIDMTTDTRLAAFARFSLEDFITEEAILAAQGFDNALAVMADSLLRSMMIMEEEWIVVGNGPSGLAQAATPSGTTAASSGATLNGTYYACCVALTYDGWKRNASNLASGLVTTFNKTSPLGELQVVNGGVSKVSAISAGVPVTTGNAINWFTSATPNAYAYAWFTGTVAAYGSLALAGITTVNVFPQTAVAAYTQLANGNGYNSTNALGAANDYSKNTTVFDGLITQAVNGNGYYKSLDNGMLMSQLDGSCGQVDDALQSFYDNWKVGPTGLWMNTQQARDLSYIVMSAGGGGAMKINIDNSPAGGGNITMGGIVKTYLNKFAVGGSPEALPINIHPNIPSGKIFIECDKIPYPLSNIPGVYQMKLQRDYYQRLWPQTTETRYSSVNFNGVLQVYTPFAMGLIDNIAKGVVGPTGTTLSLY